MHACSHLWEIWLMQCGRWAVDDAEICCQCFFLQTTCLNQSNYQYQHTIVQMTDGNITSLALDWMNGVLFWAVNGIHSTTDRSIPRIEAAHTDGHHRRTIVNGSSSFLHRPHSIALYPKYG